jgi:hypothetical protein
LPGAGQPTALARQHAVGLEPRAGADWSGHPSVVVNQSRTVQTHAQRTLKTFRTSGIGYFIEQNTRPQTIGYALLDSPAALAGWMLDHDTDAYYKVSGAFVDGQPSVA